MTNTLEKSGSGRHICDSQRLYLDLLLKSVLGLIDEDPPFPRFGDDAFDLESRIKGLDWPSRAETMVGLKRLFNARQLVENVLYENVAGDFLEAGVWRGGVGIMMRGVLSAYGITDRRVWLADSFAGLPPPNRNDFPSDSASEFHDCPELSVDIETVKQNFRKYDLLDDQVVFLKGWFKDTLPEAPVEKIALLRLDGDLYESTMQALVALYDKVSDNGYIIIDDYHCVPQCAHAVEDFCALKNIAPALNEIDGVGVYWRKPSALPEQPAESPAAGFGAAEATTSHEQDDQRQMIMPSDARLVKINQVLNKRYVQLVERDAKIARQEEKIAEQDTQIAEQEVALAELNGQLAERDALIAERDARLARNEAEITGRDYQIKEFKHQIDLMVNSRSWRITAPLRYVTREIFGRK